MLSLAQVQDVHILTHPDSGNPRGCFVAFETADEVGLAVARDGSVRLSPPDRSLRQANDP